MRLLHIVVVWLFCLFPLWAGEAWWFAIFVLALLMFFVGLNMVADQLEEWDEAEGY